MSESIETLKINLFFGSFLILFLITFTELKNIQEIQEVLEFQEIPEIQIAR